MLMIKQAVLNRQYLNVRRDDFGTVDGLDKINDLIERFVGEPPVIADHTEAELGALPEVVIAHLGNGNIEAVLYPVNNLFDDAPFFLERMILPHHQVYTAYPDHHHRLPFSLLRKMGG
jgi:hypothetical protein